VAMGCGRVLKCGCCRDSHNNKGFSPSLIRSYSGKRDAGGIIVALFD